MTKEGSTGSDAPVEPKDLVAKNPLDATEIVEITEAAEPEELIAKTPLPGHIRLHGQMPVELLQPDLGDQITAIYKATRLKANVTFYLGIAFGAAGLVFIGYSFVTNESSSVKAIVGVIQNVVSFFVIKAHTQISRGLDDLLHDSSVRRREVKLLLMADQISSPEKRDDVIVDLVKTLSRPKPIPRLRKFWAKILMA